MTGLEGYMYFCFEKGLSHKQLENMCIQLWSLIWYVSEYSCISKGSIKDNMNFSNCLTNSMFHQKGSLKGFVFLNKWSDKKYVSL